MGLHANFDSFNSNCKSVGNCKILREAKTNLDRKVMLPGNLPEYESGDGIGCIALIYIVLDN